jgi:hypothetical protein
VRQSGAGPTCEPGGGWGVDGAWAVGIEVQASDTNDEMAGPDVCCPAGEWYRCSSVTSRHAEVIAGGAKFSDLRSMQELLVSYGFVEEWLGRRAGPKAEWDRAVGTAVLGSVAIAEHTFLIGFVPHPPVLSVMRICAITQVTPLGVSSCDAEASSSAMTAVRTALLGLPARTSASCMSITPKSEVSSKVPDLDIVFAAKSVLVDVSGTDPLIPSLRQDVAGIPGHALAVRAGAKRTKYGMMAEIQGKEFFPFVVESFGCLGERCPQTVRLGVARGIIPRVLCQDDETAVSQLAFGGLAAPKR